MAAHRGFLRCCASGLLECTDDALLSDLVVHNHWVRVRVVGRSSGGNLVQISLEGIVRTCWRAIRSALSGAGRVPRLGVLGARLRIVIIWSGIRN